MAKEERDGWEEGILVFPVISVLSNVGKVKDIPTSEDRRGRRVKGMKKWKCSECKGEVESAGYDELGEHELSSSFH